MFLRWVMFALCLSFKFANSESAINPIIVQGNRFIDSVTGKPFFVKGVDYQPGGSSEITEERDPLSDPEVCARDISLFQELGINTVRIYSVNPELNHDKCMTMLAVAGIYLVLDVNSPLDNQHLNRYEPWTSYHPLYLEHIFNIIEEFSYYNNTLGFFAGNEIVNDRRSAQYSPPYIKNVIKDMKQFIKLHSPRPIPVGYSAADYLRYRVSLSKYLECCEHGNSASSVDFYGINSYQWCGSQTMESSGYDKLIDTYKSYTKPLIFSEFGCNKVLPRQFEEVSALFSDRMNDVFSGGLVYEFTQEPNNYGLVKINGEGDALLLDDFFQLKKHYTHLDQVGRQQLKVPTRDGNLIFYEQKSKNNIPKNGCPVCLDKYSNLNIDTKVDSDLGVFLIKEGVSNEHGQFVQLEDSELVSKFKIYNGTGEVPEKVKRIEILHDLGIFNDVKDKNRKQAGDNPKTSTGFRLNQNLFAVFMCFMLLISDNILTGIRNLAAFIYHV